MTAGQVLKGIEFSHPGGATPLLLDLYLPAGSYAGADQDSEAGGPGFPAVIHFHGGGWRTGERSSLGPTVDGFGLSPIEQLVEAGFVVASADYRLSAAATFPAQRLDAKAAVRWLRTVSTHGVTLRAATWPAWWGSQQEPSRREPVKLTTASRPSPPGPRPRT